MAMNRLQPKPKVGDLVYSPYFSAYLEIVNITDDDNWRFRRGGIIDDAQTALSYFTKSSVVMVWRATNE